MTHAQLLENGGLALAGGGWVASCSAFSTALESEETPESHSGLGTALWWTGEMDQALPHWERAYALFRKRSDLARASLAAVNPQPVLQRQRGKPLDGVGLGGSCRCHSTVMGWGRSGGEQKARRMLAEAGFTSVEARHVEDDVFNTYFIARKV